MKNNVLAKRWTEEELDLMTLIEPLACVQHAYGQIPETLKIKTACVFGGGPIGGLHVIELIEHFPGVHIEIIDPSPLRRKLLGKIFPDIRVREAWTEGLRFDLTIVATSDPVANIHAIGATRPRGHVIHFSGLNHKTSKDLVEVEGIDIEKLHRSEELRSLSNGTRLVGSSGYSEMDIKRAIQALIESPARYCRIQTAIVTDLSSISLFHTPTKKHDFFQRPVMELLLEDSDEYMNHLKVVFRIRKTERGIKATPSRRASGQYAAQLKPIELTPNVRPGYVRIQMLRVSICNTDRRVLQGTKAATITENLILGHEGIGFVIARGDGVGPVDGGLSLILPHFYAPEDPYLKNGIPYLSPKLKHLGVHIDGCFANVVDVPAECVFGVEAVLPKARSVLESTLAA